MLKNKDVDFLAASMTSQWTVVSDTYDNLPIESKASKTTIHHCEVMEVVKKSMSFSSNNLIPGLIFEATKIH